MPKQPDTVRCKYFVWKLRLRNGIWTADGRYGNSVAGLGRQSLGTGNYDGAIQALHQLDELRAIELGLIKRNDVAKEDGSVVELKDGYLAYLKHVSRPAILGGASGTTLKRYRAVFDKFEQFSIASRVTTWNAVTDDHLSDYTQWLEEREYAYGTLYLELTTIKQAVKWMVREHLLPARCELRTSLRKVTETTTYCYALSEVTAMIAFCDARSDLHWLREVIVVLAYTGMRIGELVAARWEDISGDNEYWEIPDHSRSGTLTERAAARRTKGRRSRRFPVQADVRKALARLRVQRRPDGWIMHGPNGGRLKADTLRIILNREVLEPMAEDRPPGVSPRIREGRLHSFRHFFCSLCASSGVPERVLINWLGHSDSKMISRYYHLHDEESQRQMQRLSMSASNDQQRRDDDQWHGAVARSA